MKTKKSVKMWIEALRSGKYKQGRSYLHRDDRYCCLGVACELYNETHERKLTKTVTPSTWETVSFDGEHCVLPTKVQDWLGLRDSSGQILDDTSLASLNDESHNFDEIADIIQIQPDGLFV